MSASWNFARRPFRDERPVFAAIGIALALGLVLGAANLRLYWNFSRQVEGTRAQIAALEVRGARAAKAAEQAKNALTGYKVSALAQESAGLQTIVRERRFSWLALLARLERTLPPEVRVARLSPHFDSVDSVTVDLAVLGRNSDSVVQTLAALSKDRAFRAVELRSESSPEKGIPEGYTFQIGLRYTPEETR
jgi:Tfp pilus assembly protein PilN